MEIDFWNNLEKNRYEAVLEKKVIGVAKYSFLPNFVLAITSTEVRSEYEGQSIAAQMIKGLLEYAQFYGYKINPICSYARVYINEHSEYKDMLATNID